MSITTYYELEAVRMMSESEKVSLFTKHSGSVGAYREAILRSYVKGHVPGRFRTSSGFITDHGPESAQIYDVSSLQLDCVVYDGWEHAPLLDADEFAVVEPEAVAAVVEVKSNLRFHRQHGNGARNADFPFEGETGKPFRWSGELTDALANVKSAIDVLQAAGVPRHRYYVGILGFSGNDLLQLEAALSSGQLLQQLDISHWRQLPDAICVLTGGCWSFSPFEWEDDFNQAGHHDPALTWTVWPDAPGDGTALQFFTAEFTHVLRERQGIPHRTGGLRSAMGYKGPMKSRSFDLPSDLPPESA